MSKVVREDSDDLTAVLTVTVEKKDYEPKFQKELNKYRKQAHLKGFRKGKMPMSAVRKMYGKSVLVEVVNQELQEELYRYLTEEKIDMLGQPLPSGDQEPIEFDLKDLHDYVFKFDIGLAPDFEVQGIREEDEFLKYAVDIPEQMIDEELENARLRYGTQKQSEGEILENDLLKVKATELDGGEVRTDGVESSFNLLIKNIDNEEVKQALLHSKVGDTLRLDLFGLGESMDDSFVRRHFLKLEEEDKRMINPEFEVIIEEATRTEPAELNPEFFDKYFGAGEVSNEEEARNRIREEIKKYFDNQADALLFRDFQNALMEKNKLALPRDFLLRWLKTNNEKIPEEEIAEEYDNFSENLRWSLIRGKLVKDFGISINQEDILERFKNQIRGYLGGGEEELVTSMAMRMLENKKQFDSTYEDVLTDRLAEAIEGRVTIETKPISRDDFREMVEKAQEEARKVQGGKMDEEE